MKNSKFLKTVAGIIVLSFISVTFFNLLAADPSTSLQTVVDNTTKATTPIKTIVQWILGVLELIGIIVVAAKMFSGKPDARDGLIGWVAGLIFIAVAFAVATATL